VSAFEFDALRQIVAHPASCHIPPNIQSRLRDIGYLKEVLDGIVVTADGLQRIAMENGSMRPDARSADYVIWVGFAPSVRKSKKPQAFTRCGYPGSKIDCH
jgi:hypothetical protein